MSTDITNVCYVLITKSNSPGKQISFRNITHLFKLIKYGTTFMLHSKMTEPILNMDYVDPDPQYQISMARKTAK